MFDAGDSERVKLENCRGEDLFHLILENGSCQTQHEFMPLLQLPSYCNYDGNEDACEA